jgi:group II intron reverse transcriptase/maturase
MPEDAPGNPGAVRTDAQPAGRQAAQYRKVREMQAKLHRWAGENRSRRFGDLFNLVSDLEFLAEGWLRVKANAGSKTPGIDKATVADIENRIGVGVFLDRIRDSLKSGEFRPVPVRQVMIPKKSGKLRKLGIPTVTDRVVQAALKLVLEPIFEADFQPCSYGFRPNRRAHDAIAEIHYLASRPRNYEWVLEADIRACFDEIGHVPLMDRLRARITDKRVLALVKAFLKAGIMTADGDREETYTGTPAGGILSPLLANIALSALDDHFTRQWQTQMGTTWQRAKRRQQGLGTWRLVRFADDFVIMVNGTRAHAEALREEAAAVLAPMGLRLAEETGHDEAVRLHVPVPEGHPGHQGQDLSQDVQVNPEPGPGCAHPEHQPDPGRVGELPPSRSLQGRVQRDRPSCMGPDHALAKAEIQTRELPYRDASTAPPLLRARDLAVRSQRSQVHRRVSRAGHPLPLPRQQHTGPVGTPAGPGNQLTPAGKTRGAPGAVRVARRVRRAGRGNPPGAILAGRPGPTQLLHNSRSSPIGIFRRAARTEPK